jgi:aerobic-type carbon monoxide dehydrogenase small subunit (CoxS/CutS family)
MMPTTREMVTITVNGRRQSREVECRRLLSDFLRHDLGLTGTHVGCEQGVCGSCNHGLQCGFCTPGILMTVDAARAEGASLESVENDLLSGHMCRCTGYSGIRAAVRALWDAARP